MADRSLSQALPGDWEHGGYADREPHYGADSSAVATAGANGTGPPWPYSARNTDPFGTAVVGAYGAAAAEVRTARQDTGRRAPAARPSAPHEAADANGFLGALFDFGFTSFVTPKIIRVLYLLVMIGTVVSALAFTIMVFKVSAAFGVVALIFGDPLVILVVMAIYRIFLEFFVVIFRAAEDIRALREHGETG